MKTKLKIIVMANLLSIFTGSCDFLKNEAQQNKEAPTNTLHHNINLVVDQSLSTSNCSMEELIKKLKPRMAEILTTSGDKVNIAYIFSNSASSKNTPAHVFTYDIPEPLQLSGLSDVDQQAAEIQYKDDVIRNEQRFLNRTVKFLKQPKPKSSLTDVFGIFRVLESLSKDTTQKHHAIFISDMVHTDSVVKMKPISSFSEAELFAQELAPIIIEKYDLEKDCLKNLESIEVLLYGSALNEDKQRFTFLPEFYKALFKMLGFQNEVSFK